MADQGD